jgi:hypothetical protein
MVSCCLGDELRILTEKELVNVPVAEDSERGLAVEIATLTTGVASSMMPGSVYTTKVVELSIAVAIPLQALNAADNGCREQQSCYAQLAQSMW